jgi:hypothetical protein
MTEKKAKTATPHLRETPEQQQQVEHEEAIEDAGKRSSKFGISCVRQTAYSDRGARVRSVEVWKN